MVEMNGLEECLPRATFGTTRALVQQRERCEHGQILGVVAPHVRLVVAKRRFDRVGNHDAVWTDKAF